MFTINSNIFNKTLLEGIPFKLKYLESKPKFIYKVGKSGITLHGYRDWNDVSENPPVSELRNLFLHDTCHLILYYLRGDNDRIFTSEFGLTWDHVKHFTFKNKFFNLFSNKKERVDEYKIAAIHQILKASMSKKASPTYMELKKLVSYNMNYMWHTKKIDSVARQYKRDEIKQACDYIYHEVGVQNIRDTARSLVEYLQDNVTYH